MSQNQTDLDLVEVTPTMKKSKPLAPKEKGAKAEKRRKAYQLKQLVELLGNQDPTWLLHRRTARQMASLARTTFAGFTLSEDDKVFLLEEGDTSFLNGQCHD